MKRLIQISLIVILVLVVFQTAAGGSVIASRQADLGTASNISSLENTSTDGVPLAACFSGIKGVICVTPNVGWNS